MRATTGLAAVVLAATIFGCGGGGASITGARSSTGPTSASPSGTPTLGGFSTKVPAVTSDAVKATGTVSSANFAAGTLTVGMLSGIQGFTWNGEPMLVLTTGSTQFSAQDGTLFRADTFFGFAQNAGVTVTGFANTNGTMTATMVEVLGSSGP